MTRCPYLDYESNTYIFNSFDKYICQLTGQKMDIDDSIVKHICNCDSGYEYEKCPFYKDR